MDVDDFWDLIERSGRETDTRQERVSWLVDELSRRPAEEIIDYYIWWKSAQACGGTVDLYAAYWFVFNMGSLDGFEYFVNWLVSLGRETFEAVTDCPDRLIELPQVQRLLQLEKLHAIHSKRRPQDPDQMREEEPEFERLAYVAYYAYEQVTGQEPDRLGEAAETRGASRGVSAGSGDRQRSQWRALGFRR